MGSIYKANHILLNRIVVLKVLPDGIVNPRSYVRFQNEARALSKLNHPNIAQIYDFGLHDNTPYIAIEYIEGLPLNKTLADSGPMSVDEAVPIVRQLCDALAHAHAAGIIHRDLKPGNIMIRHTGGETQAVLLDFGIAKLTTLDPEENSGSLTRPGDLIGCPPYMSPEQCEGKPIDNRTDQYSLGCVLFEMLSGMPPFVGDNALHTILLHRQEVSPKVSSVCDQSIPVALENLIAKLLEKDPNKRFDSIEQAAEQLFFERKDDTQIERTQIQSIDGSIRKASRSQMISISIVAVLLIGFVLGTIFWPRKSEEMPKTTTVYYSSIDVPQGFEEELPDGLPSNPLEFRAKKFATAEALEEASRSEEIQILTAPESTIRDKELAYFVNSKAKLLNVNLSGVKLDSVNSLVGITTLQQLILPNTGIGDRDLTKLSSLPMLNWLDISSTNVTEKGLATLARFPSLSFVVLDKRTSKATIEALSKKCPCCLFNNTVSQTIFMDTRNQDIDPNLSFPKKLALTKQCMAILEKVQPKGSAVVYCLLRLSAYELALAHRQKALLYINKAIDKAKSIGNRVLLSDCMFTKAVVLWQTGIQENSIGLYQQAIECGEYSLNSFTDVIAKNDPKLVERMVYLADWESCLQKHSASLQYGKKAMFHVNRYFAKNDNVHRVVNERIGWTLYTAGKHDNALSYFQKTLNYYLKQKDLPGFIKMKVQIANCTTDENTKTKLFLEAVGAFEKLPSNFHSSDKVFQCLYCDACITLSSTYAKQNKLDKAIKFSQMAFNYACKIHDREETYGRNLIEQLNKVNRNREAKEVAEKLERIKKADKI